MPLVVFTDTMEINQDNIIIINKKKKKKNKSHIKSRTHLFKKQQKKKTELYKI